jgi:hypothetical protein
MILLLPSQCAAAPFENISALLTLTSPYCTASQMPRGNVCWSLLAATVLSITLRLPSPWPFLEDFVCLIITPVKPHPQPSVGITRPWLVRVGALPASTAYVRGVHRPTSPIASATHTHCHPYSYLVSINNQPHITQAGCS